MKLRRVNNSEEPDYPSFEEYQANRRKFLKGLAAGVGAVALVGCDKKSDPCVAGEMPLPGLPPEPDPPDDPQKLGGKPLAPQQPEREPVQLEGDVAMPETIPQPQVKGRIRPPDPPKKLAGKIRPPDPPVKPEIERKLPGEVVAPQPPKLGGVEPVPQQPRLRGAVAAPLQNPEPK